MASRIVSVVDPTRKVSLIYNIAVNVLALVFIIIALILIPTGISRIMTAPLSAVSTLIAGLLFAGAAYYVRTPAL